MTPLLVPYHRRIAMAMFRCPNPACGIVSEVPERFAGQRVRRKICRTEFLASDNSTALSPEKLIAL